MWDINGGKSNKIEAKNKFTGHSNVVEDVCWHSKQSDIFGSVGL